MSYPRGQQQDHGQQDVIRAVIDNDVTRLASIIENGKVENFTGTNYSIPKDFLNTDITTTSNNSPITLPTTNLSLIHIAALCDSLEVFIYLCQLKKDKFHTRTPSGASYHPLHYACCSAAYEVAFYILSIDPDEAKETPAGIDWHFIYLAAESGDPDILNLILDNGANINSEANKRNNSINQAIRKKSIECLRILLEKGSKEAHDNRNYSPIMLAITNNQFMAVPILLDAGDDPEYFAPDGQSALFLACFQRSTETVRLLCEKMQIVDIDPTITGKALIHHACGSCDPEIVRIVLTKNIDVNRLDKDGRLGPWYLIDLAKEEDIIRILEMLVEKGFNINLVKKLPNGRTSDPLI